MRFTVPKFIEHEAKIVGPLTFKQFVFIAIAGVICFVLYFTVSFTIFIIACFVLGGIALGFSFLTIDGTPLPNLIGNFLKFNLSPKMYLWKRKEGVTAIEEEMMKKEEMIPESKVSLKIGGGSRLKSTRTRIETKS